MRKFVVCAAITLQTEGDFYWLWMNVRLSGALHTACCLRHAGPR